MGDADPATIITDHVDRLEKGQSSQAFYFRDAGRWPMDLDNSFSPQDCLNGRRWHYGIEVDIPPDR